MCLGVIFRSGVMWRSGVSRASGVVQRSGVVRPISALGVSIGFLVIGVVTGRMHSDRSGSVRRLAGCNYGGNGGRVLIMAAMAAAQLN